VPRPPAPVAAPQRVPVGSQVVSIGEHRRAEPREWNLWELEKMARVEARRTPERADEWSYMFVHLRQYAEPGGQLPADFDALVRDAFGSLLDELERT
jgi:hypothetical protein